MINFMIKLNTTKIIQNKKSGCKLSKGAVLNLQGCKYFGIYNLK